MGLPQVFQMAFIYSWGKRFEEKLSIISIQFSVNDSFSILFLLQALH